MIWNVLTFLKNVIFKFFKCRNENFGYLKISSIKSNMKSVPLNKEDKEKILSYINKNKTIRGPTKMKLFNMILYGDTILTKKQCKYILKYIDDEHHHLVYMRLYEGQWPIKDDDETKEAWNIFNSKREPIKIDDYKENNTLSINSPILLSPLPTDNNNNFYF